MKKSFKEWAKDLGVKLYSGYLRKLEQDDFHIRKISAKEFIRLLKTAEFTFNNRNKFNRRLISFSNKHKIKKEQIGTLLEIKRDDFVKFKSNNRILIGRYQSELGSGKELVEIEVNGGGALNYFYVEKSKILFPTKKEILKTLKKTSVPKNKNQILSVDQTNQFY